MANLMMLALLLLQLIATESAHIGLFASTGCYSHDIMMRHFADRLTSMGHRVTLIQIRVYEFNRTVPSKRSESITSWDHLVYEACGEDSERTLRRLQRHMWTSSVPFDGNSWTTEGIRILTQLHKHHIHACFNALRDQRFMEDLQRLRLDLLVTDYVLNECALRFSSILDVNLAYLSNYPILCSYVSDVGIPSNPSFVPSVVGYETTKMPFHRRVFNAMVYSMLWTTRQWFDFDATHAFKHAIGRRFYKKVRSKSSGRAVLTFATPFEFIVDTSRPIARNLHYYGCDHCFEAATGPVQKASEMLNISTSPAGVIIVSFGTVTKGDQIPIIQLERLVRTFAAFPSQTFVWQSDLIGDEFKNRLLTPANLSLPSNIHMFPWIPMKRLLRDSSVVLSINHGGISTCFEALHHGVPILGIALQGDQGYNLRRFVEKGVAEMLAVSDLTVERLHEKLSVMIGNIEKYRSAALKLGAMVRDYRLLHNRAPSEFWVDWTARHFGRSRNASRTSSKARRFLILRYPSNWFVYYSLDVLAVFAAGSFATVWLAWASWSFLMRLHVSKEVKY